MAGRHGVEHDQEHVRGTGRRKRSRLGVPLFDATCAKTDAARIADERSQHRQAESNPSPKTGGMPFQQRDQT